MRSSYNCRRAAGGLVQCASCDQDDRTETVLPLTLNKPIVHDEQRGAERAGCGGVRTQARNTQDSAMGGRGVVQLRGQRCVRARASAQRAYSRGVDARQQPDGPLPAAQPAPARRTRLPACLLDERTPSLRAAPTRPIVRAHTAPAPLSLSRVPEQGQRRSHPLRGALHRALHLHPQHDRDCGATARRRRQEAAACDR